MNTKILALTIALLLCLSCSQSKSKQAEVNTDTTTVYSQSETSESDLFNNLTRLEKKKINTKLQYNTSFIKPILFSEDDWENVKKAYNKWRKEEIAKGNYQEECPDAFLNQDDEDDEDYVDRLGMDALPNIPAKFKRDGEVHYGEMYMDTLMADINFDGKLDVVFKVDPMDCMGSSSLLPTIYPSFLSKENQYQTDNSWTVSKAIEAIIRFNYEAGDGRVATEGAFVSSIEAKDGVIIISGNSAATEYFENSAESDDDPNCCPSYWFEYDFHYYIDKSGNGYADIDGMYVNDRNETKKRFVIKY
jgi:hypothetical protein